MNTDSQSPVSSMNTDSQSPQSESDMNTDSNVSAGPGPDPLLDNFMIKLKNDANFARA